MSLPGCSFSLARVRAPARGARGGGVPEEGGRVAVADAIVGLEQVNELVVPGHLAGADEVEPVADGLAVLLLDGREVERWACDALRHGGLLSVRCCSGR